MSHHRPSSLRVRVGRGAARGGDFGLQAVKMGMEGAGGGAVGVRGQRLGQQEAASGGGARRSVPRLHSSVWGGYHEGPRGVIHAYARLWGPTSLPMAQGLMTSRMRVADDVHERLILSRHFIEHAVCFVRSLKPNFGLGDPLSTALSTATASPWASPPTAPSAASAARA